MKAALHIANERLAIAVSISQDALLSITLTGQITSWNRAAERLFGYAADDVIGQNIAMLLDPEGQQEQLEFLARVCAGEALGPEDTKRLRKDGMLIDVSISAAPVRSIDRSVISVAVAIQDISRRKEWEVRQRSMTRELTHRVKNSFTILQSILQVQNIALDYRVNLLLLINSDNFSSLHFHTGYNSSYKNKHPCFLDFPIHQIHLL